jgi:Cys-rich protein (TIGR01571 family)
MNGYPQQQYYAQQLVAAAQTAAPSMSWEEAGGGCLACTNDCEALALACCCLPCLFGSNMEQTGNGSLCMHCMIPLCLGPFGVCYLAWGRSRIQQRITGYSGDFLGNCCLYFWCSTCAEAENTRAVKSWRRAGGNPYQGLPPPVMRR